MPGMSCLTWFLLIFALQIAIRMSTVDSVSERSPLEVRLVDGPNNTTGRVEVKYNGTWETICDNGWDLNEAKVVCRMLGFERALGAPGGAAYGQGSGDILFHEVSCSGYETTIADCYHRGIGQHSCNHSQDAGVICEGTPLEFRLADGPNNSSGRVEVKFNGTWGTICDDGWDLEDAAVICRMQGFDRVLGAPGGAAYGQGSGDILFDEVRCWWWDDSFADCYHKGIGEHDCDHSQDASVICEDREVPLEVRLVDGPNNYAGRVEVKYNGTWGTICDNRWDLDGARVVCRMLGFEGALGAPGGAAYGQGSGNILLEEVSCGGNEYTIADCYHKGIGEHNCNHSQDAGVICEEVLIEIRLADGPNNSSGRVEVKYNGTWGTICDDNWSMTEAEFVCRMLGFDRVWSATGGAQFGQGSGPILFDGMDCHMVHYWEDYSLTACNHEGIGQHDCDHSQDAGVICEGDPLEVRLVDGPNNATGRVELKYNGTWGTICDKGWDLDDARVVCRMLGFEGALGAPVGAAYGQGSGNILLNYVSCSGGEDNIAECIHRGKIRKHSCDHSQDAGVICKEVPLEVRLVDGPNNSSGRVEVKYNGTWGTICDNWWTMHEAMVVCRMLGFDRALGAPRGAAYGQGSGNIFIEYVRCWGDEDTIGDCFHLGIGNHSCHHNEEAAVVKCEETPLEVRLVNGPNNATGRVEVKYNGTWGTICDDGWGLNEAKVVCRMLGFERALGAPGGAAYGQGSGDILFDEVSCSRSQNTIADCYHRGLGEHDCAHSQDAGVICEGVPLEIRLVDGPNNSSGRVELKYNGTWGTICDNGWSVSEATVVCRMLGFDRAWGAPGRAFYGQGSGDILLGYVDCRHIYEDVDNIADCRHRGFGQHDCDHRQDAGVKCKGKSAHPCVVRNPCMNGECRYIGYRQYRCDCYEPYEGTHCNAIRRPNGPLDVVTHPDNETVEIGNRVELTCGFKNAEYYEWFKEGEPLSNTKNLRTLIIQSVSPIDIGYYFCRGHNDGRTMDTKMASIYIAGHSNIRISNLKFNGHYEGNFTSRASTMYQNMSDTINEYIQEGLEKHTVIKQLSPSVVCRALLRDEGIIADINVYIKGSNRSAFQELDLISQAISSLADNSSGFLDVGRMEIENTAICRNSTWNSPRFGPVHFPEGENGTWVNSTKSCPFNTTNVKLRIGNAICVGDLISQSTWLPLDTLDICGSFRHVSDLLSQIYKVYFSCTLN